MFVLKKQICSVCQAIAFFKSSFCVSLFPRDDNSEANMCFLLFEITLFAHTVVKGGTYLVEIFWKTTRRAKRQKNRKEEQTMGYSTSVWPRQLHPLHPRSFMVCWSSLISISTQFSANKPFLSLFKLFHGYWASCLYVLFAEIRQEIRHDTRPGGILGIGVH